MNEQTKREQITEYLLHLEENFKGDLIALWETCCDLCGWLDLDSVSLDVMTDIILDYNTSLFDEDIKAILEGVKTA